MCSIEYPRLVPAYVNMEKRQMRAVSDVCGYIRPPESLVDSTLFMVVFAEKNRPLFPEMASFSLVFGGGSRKWGRCR